MRVWGLVIRGFLDRSLPPFLSPLSIYFYTLYIYISILFRFNSRRWPASISLLSLLYITCIATISLLYFHLYSCGGRLLVSLFSLLYVYLYCYHILLYFHSSSCAGRLLLCLLSICTCIQKKALYSMLCGASLVYVPLRNKTCVFVSEGSIKHFFFLVREGSRKLWEP